MDTDDAILQALQNLLSGTVHEINNALAPILLYGDLIKESAASEGIARKADAILEQAGKIRASLESLRILYKGSDAGDSSPSYFAPHFQRLLRPIFQKVGTRTLWAVEVGQAPLASRGDRQKLEFMAAATSLAKGSPPYLWFLWLGSEPSGSRIAAVAAPPDRPAPSSSVPGSRADVVLLSTEEIAALFKEVEPLVLLNYPWP